MSALNKKNGFFIFLAVILFSVFYVTAAASGKPVRENQKNTVLRNADKAVVDEILADEAFKYKKSNNPLLERIWNAVIDFVKKIFKKINPDISDEGLKSVLKVIMYSIIAAGCLLAVFLLFQIARLVLRKRLNKDISGYTIENIISGRDFEISDVRGEIEAAKKNGDYKSAVRLYYLLALDYLNGRQLIRLKKDKTDFEYLRELKDDYYNGILRSVISDYHRIFFGNYDVTDFTMIEMRVNEMLEKVTDCEK